MTVGELDDEVGTSNEAGVRYCDVHDGSVLASMIARAFELRNICLHAWYREDCLDSSYLHAW